ncbi:hypothetical protein [Streptomyces sp. NK08204]|uniref:hypothetical protein n=1 Tax=Streptomyces sp. NK08204 TaxID=2873260 RepID=UPI001CECE475|nr:hypothetical protein [Streptomyces sp. NK08204]
MDGGRTGRQGVARLLMLCAVLLGLFLMHGAPTAAGGCHGETAVMDSPVPHGDHRAAAATMADAATTTHAAHAGTTASVVRAHDASGMPGELCVSTPAHQRTSVPAPALLGVAALAALALRSPTLLRSGRAMRRGPPSGGRTLLLQVCVART